ncbi:MAG TPA: LysR family transcriptional regulator [Acidimicrobiales bacterium]|nr:LysR family transcriptional regulator [Acidimicrobiales bacterium]
MDRSDLELVVAIGRTGSLTAASRQLHIAQPPLSRRLKRIESEIGAPLFTRGRHGATPTVVGRTLVERAETALAAIRRAEQDAEDVASGRAGRLNIGVTPTLGAVLLPGALAAFRLAHPDVRLDLVASGDSAQLRQDVRDGELDVALAVLVRPPEPGTRVALKGQQRFVLIAPRDQRLGRSTNTTKVRRAVLADLPVVALTKGTGLRQQLDDVFDELGVSPEIAIETSEREMLVPFVAAGLGVSLVPEGFVTGRAPGCTIHELDPPVRRPVGAVVAKGRLPALVTALLDTLIETTDLD